MRLVAHLLHQLQCRRCRTWLHLTPIRQQQGFIPRLARRPLGHTHQNHTLNARINQDITRLRQLPGTTINQQHIRQHDIGPPFRSSPKPPLQGLMHGGVIITRLDAIDVVASILLAHCALGIEYHTRRHRSLAHGVTNVETFNPRR